MSAHACSHRARRASADRQSTSARGTYGAAGCHGAALAARSAGACADVCASSSACVSCGCGLWGTTSSPDIMRPQMRADVPWQPEQATCAGCGPQQATCRWWRVHSWRKGVVIAAIVHSRLPCRTGPNRAVRWLSRSTPPLSRSTSDTTSLEGRRSGMLSLCCSSICRMAVHTSLASAVAFAGHGMRVGRDMRTGRSTIHTSSATLMLDSSTTAHKTHKVRRRPANTESVSRQRTTQSERFPRRHGQRRRWQQETRAAANSLEQLNALQAAGKPAERTAQTSQRRARASAPRRPGRSTP